MTDKEASAYYSLPENQKPGKRLGKRSKSGLSGHVPVRFPETVVAQIKVIADLDGLTVSSWIRHVVMREVEHRQPSRSIGTGFEVSWNSNVVAQTRSIAANAVTI